MDEIERVYLEIAAIAHRAADDFAALYPYDKVGISSVAQSTFQRECNKRGLDWYGIRVPV